VNELSYVEVLGDKSTMYIWGDLTLSLLDCIVTILCGVCMCGLCNVWVV
jgi:hypothetical protein